MAEPKLYSQTIILNSHNLNINNTYIASMINARANSAMGNYEQGYQQKQQQTPFQYTNTAQQASAKATPQNNLFSRHRQQHAKSPVSQTVGVKQQNQQFTQSISQNKVQKELYQTVQQGENSSSSQMMATTIDVHALPAQTSPHQLQVTNVEQIKTQFFFYIIKNMQQQLQKTMNQTLTKFSGNAQPAHRGRVVTQNQRQQTTTNKLQGGNYKTLDFAGTRTEFGKGNGQTLLDTSVERRKVDPKTIYAHSGGFFRNNNNGKLTSVAAAAQSNWQDAQKRSRSAQRHQSVLRAKGSSEMGGGLFYGGEKGRESVTPGGAVTLPQRNLISQQGRKNISAPRARPKLVSVHQQQNIILHAKDSQQQKADYEEDCSFDELLQHRTQAKPVQSSEKQSESSSLMLFSSSNNLASNSHLLEQQQRIKRPGRKTREAILKKYAEESQLYETDELLLLPAETRVKAPSKVFHRPSHSTADTSSKIAQQQQQQSSLAGASTSTVSSSSQQQQQQGTQPSQSTQSEVAVAAVPAPTKPLIYSFNAELDPNRSFRDFSQCRNRRTAITPEGARSTTPALDLELKNLKGQSSVNKQENQDSVQDSQCLKPSEESHRNLLDDYQESDSQCSSRAALGRQAVSSVHQNGSANTDSPKQGEKLLLNTLNDYLNKDILNSNKLEQTPIKKVIEGITSGRKQQQRQKAPDKESYFNHLSSNGVQVVENFFFFDLETEDLKVGPKKDTTAKICNNNGNKTPLGRLLVAGANKTPVRTSQHHIETFGYQKTGESDDIIIQD